jgi:hypothetical protein
MDGQTVNNIWFLAVTGVVLYAAIRFINSFFRR